MSCSDCCWCCAFTQGASGVNRNETLLALILSLIVLQILRWSTRPSGVLYAHFVHSMTQLSIIIIINDSIIYYYYQLTITYPDYTFLAQSLTTCGSGAPQSTRTRSAHWSHCSQAHWVSYMSALVLSVLMNRCDSVDRASRLLVVKQFSIDFTF